jgi:hypothetical protein
MPVPVKATAWQKPSATVHKISANGKKSTKIKRKNMVLGVYYTERGLKLIFGIVFALCLWNTVRQQRPKRKDYETGRTRF